MGFDGKPGAGPCPGTGGWACFGEGHLGPTISFFEGAPLFSASARPGCGGLEGAGSRELRT